MICRLSPRIVWYKFNRYQIQQPPSSLQRRQQVCNVAFERPQLRRLKIVLLHVMSCGLANFQDVSEKNYCLCLRADSHTQCRSPAANVPRPCHYPPILRQCRTLAGRPHAVSGRPIIIHTYHAVPLPRTCRGLERSLSERHIRAMAGERHGKMHGMCVSITAAQC
jgi:hypothetical protein